ncbi:non-ribosomal peptide synthetase [Xenorhabdus littoralis]|uniref:non-ribosomal peptide synthetase n=1 Tax=Xenorhabdus littoralis TaxID=2582835 RepID=UPI0029E802A4|nr:amino acid adenylation domain-containing protein [Xenorhabdus sp. psl]MDX7990726.1 amino acid adenylation domain-containing protein [Xenorhabdus sp. psl]
MNNNTHRTMVFPASHSQEQLWFLNELAPDSQLAYTMAVRVSIDGDLDVLKLQRAVNQVVASQEILRTSFSYTNGKLSQTVSPSATLPIHTINYLDDVASALQLINMEVKRKWFLGQAPLYRLLLIKTGQSHHELVLSTHHIVCDGISLQLLLKRIFMAYETGHDFIDADALQFADYAVWNKQTTHQGIDYWRSQLAGASTVLDVAPMTQRKDKQSFTGSRIPLNFNHNEWQSIRQRATQIGVSAAAVFLAAYCIILHRITEQDDILVGIPTSNRIRPELRNVIGYLSNICVFRSQYDEEQSVTDYLKQIQRTLSDLIDNSETPLPEILRTIEHVRAPGLPPLFQVLFGYEQDTPHFFDSGSLHLTFSDVDTGASRLDLSLFLFEDQDRNTTGFLEYATDVLDASTAIKISSMLEQVLRQFAHLPPLQLNELSMGQGDSRVVSAPLETEFQSIPDQLSILAKKQPDALALFDEYCDEYSDEYSDEHRQLTFRELNQQIIHAAGILMNTHGIVAGSHVAVMGKRGVAWVVTMLAIWQLDAVYIPLDVTMPESRLQEMLSRLSNVTLIADETMPESFRQWQPIPMASLWCHSPQYSPQHYPQHTAQPETRVGTSASYIMFTSGSTGHPKAVMVRQDNLVSTLTAFGKLLNISSSDRMLALTTFSFDISLLELLLMLVHGGSVHIAPAEAQRDGSKLIEYLNNHEITLAQATPITWSLALMAGWSPRKNLRMLCGGEQLPQDLADRLCQPGMTLWNLYGPTETTIWSTAYQIQPQTNQSCTQSCTIRLGAPIAGTQLTVVDKHLQPVPKGFLGELMISGLGVSSGYYGNAPETARKFLPDPFATGARAYLTGDMVRMLPDNSLLYVGRRDDQIKLRGHRIELGEIEVALRKLPNVKDAAAYLPSQRSENAARLQAFIIFSTHVEDEQAWMTQALNALKRDLPKAWIPTEYFRISDIPLTHNGKRDKKHLQSHAIRINATVESIAPRNEAEAKIHDVWSQLLGTNHFGITDDFFQLGGHSILVAQMVERIETAFGERIPIADIYISPTIARIAATLESMKFDTGIKTEGVQGNWEFNTIALNTFNNHAHTPSSSQVQEKSSGEINSAN